MELDHIFCLVGAGFPREQALKDVGCTVGFGRQHPGQGTENRLLLLANAYLEFIWIRDPAEARSNVLRLDRRWATGGAVGCPFGIGLRGELPEAVRGDFFEYRLDGLPGRIWVSRPSNEDGMLPLLFVIDSPGDPPPRSPRDYGFPEKLFQHRCGATEIERVTIMGPGIEDLRIPATSVPVDRWPDDSWRMDVEVASHVHDRVTVVPGFQLLLRRRGPGIVGPGEMSGGG